MLRFLRKLWPFRRRPAATGELAPGVRTVEVGVGALRALPAYPFAVGPVEAGPVGEPIYVGPSIARPRWWQPWRWYLRPRYRRECRDALAKFEELFGCPADGRPRLTDEA